MDNFGQNPYLNLAQLARPEIPGMALRPSLSAGAAVNYAADKNQFQGYLQSAASVADSDQIIRKSAQDEWSAGAPGRSAATQINNIMKQDELSDVGTSMEVARGERRGKLSDQAKKRMEAEVKGLEPYVNAWERAKTPEEQMTIMEAMKQSGASFGGKPLGQMAPQQIDSFMRKFAIPAIRNTQQMNIEQLKSDTKLSVAEIGAEAKMSVAELTAKTQIQLKKLGLESKQAQEKEYERITRKMGQAPETVTEAEARIWNILNTVRALAAINKGEMAKPQLSVTPGGGIQSVKPAVTPVPEWTPPENEATPAAPAAKLEVTLPPEAVKQLKEGQVTTFKNKQMWALKGGKPVRIQ